MSKRLRLYNIIAFQVILTNFPVLAWASDFVANSKQKNSLLLWVNSHSSCQQSIIYNFFISLDNKQTDRKRKPSTIDTIDLNSPLLFIW